MTIIGRFLSLVAFCKAVYTVLDCEISFPLDLLPPHCIQPTQVKCSCLLSFFFNYQPEDGQWKGPKHVVDLYVINYTYLYRHIVVLDKYTHSNLVYYKHNGDDETYGVYGV